MDLENIFRNVKLSKTESSSALNWVRALAGKETGLICFTGDYQSPLAQAADTAFIIHDPQKYDDDIYWSNPLFSLCRICRVE